ncbi:MAG: retroviral-like aspartic protease family protein [Sphingomonas bacterium]|nr:retroviral-like aspartic protease family protein [Sphingomonas bacterium]
MTTDVQLGGLYVLMAIMLVVGTLISRRGRIARLATATLTWVVMFGAGFILFTFRDDLGFVFQRLRSEATGTPVVQAGQLRIPQALDGHFYIEASINGRMVRFLVDSGATMTTIGRGTAARANLAVSAQRDQMVRTGNGIVRVATARAGSFDVGIIRRSNVGLHIADSDEFNVLGMNYLSSLKRWGVEGRWLILEG